ncbi:AI-2E family transporter [Dactylosporangium aurantiacum]|uniref:AI-2E family transporter n=1 Tax=Dactylosporangium aurantiacum TaxID=35754 RepID=A0A9Q9IDU6_9ACTN|nr:AI-2E family transporter [Dactylosporangium aurantiacum]MDG6102153.1 AI-2E family transporter [Dactylosporangium aurantiacum]UWZ53526.1 AI-2E family transporter [Dactylosporangium aurantiacum]
MTSPGGGTDFGRAYRWAVAAGLGLLTVAAGAFALYTVRQILVQVIIAVFVAVSLDPAVRLLIRRGVRRSVAVAVIVVLALLVLAGFVWSMVPPLVGQGGDLLRNIPQYLQELPERSQTYREVADRYGLTEKLTEYAKTLPAKVGGGALGVLTGIFSALLNVLLVTVLTIYFMADLPRVRRGIVRLVPRQGRPRAAQAINVVVDKVGGYMIGNLIISLFAGVSSFVCLFLLDVPFALPLAFFVAVTDLIPLIGATVGAVGCTVVALVTGDLWPTAVVVAVFFLLYQQLENYLIAPRVLRNTVDLSSIAVLLAALVGGAILGVVGALMAIPVVAAVKVLMTPMVEALNEPPAERDPPAEPPVPIPPAARDLPAPRDLEPGETSKLEA